MIVHRNYAHNLSCCEIKVDWKKSQAWTGIERYCGAEQPSMFSIYAEKKKEIPILAGPRSPSV